MGGGRWVVVVVDGGWWWTVGGRCGQWWMVEGDGGGVVDGDGGGGQWCEKHKVAAFKISYPKHVLIESIYSYSSFSSVIIESSMKRIAKGSYGYGHCYGYGGHDQEDRLSSLSDDLLIPILSHLDTKLAVQSSILSKRWVNLWKFLPVLNFTSHNVKSDYYFFIHKVLVDRSNSIVINRFNIRVSDYRTVARVLRDALTHGVSDLSIDTSENLDKYRPISCFKSSDSLIHLSLKGMLDFGKLPSFVGLVSLRLERARIVESEPFSCFPNLEKLYLVNCKMEICSAGLEVIASKLSVLSISSCFHIPVPYFELMLSTPKLTLLELEGLIPMGFVVVDELPCLHTVHIDLYFTHNFDGVVNYQQKFNLIHMLGYFKNAECVHLSPSTVELLSLSESMLVKEHCPFDNLKLLNLIPPPNKPAPQLDSWVTAYLFKDCPRVVVKAMPR
ncbi:hypothetical protein QVD17_36174 [Tagetes erecta]|uniref:F-box domain-containing protein n=1 Tax=Tagetes erecta TaxID=13708 RepID=A0AAD8JY22_TARER|nr:hypothetical protein QVD17_36174 [Tagetes erecta]